MGYEIAGGIGVKRGAPERDVIIMVGDGSYLMLSSELATAVAENLKVIVVLIQNHGYASIGHLSETVGSERFGTRFAPVDLAMNALSYGIEVVEIGRTPSAIADLSAAMARAKASTASTVIHIESDPLLFSPDGNGWWDVPVPEVSTLEATSAARAGYERQRTAQRPLLGGGA
jgi:3D-(3,5/4)-trihydroxycyclohexane-1,2-dione acylhydrolase (decyclizing)